MKRIFLLRLGLILILAGLFTSQPVHAQQPTPSDDQVNALARQLYCPVCENTPLDICPTRACAQWRELIREKIEKGWSDDQIKQYFAEQYGEQVLAIPDVNGPNRIIFIVPVFLFLASGIFVYFYIRSLRRRTKLTGTPMPEKLPEDDPYLARVEEELANHRKR